MAVGGAVGRRWKPTRAATGCGASWFQTASWRVGCLFLRTRVDVDGYIHFTRPSEDAATPPVDPNNAGGGAAQTPPLRFDEVISHY